MAQGTCSFGDGLPVHAHGWCNTHYGRWRRHGDPLIIRRIFNDAQARFESKIDRSGGPDACHPWQDTLNEQGYGRFAVSPGVMRYAHILSWEAVNGPVPPGKELDHECHNLAVQAGTCSPGRCGHRRCCNDRHLVPRTDAEHALASAGARGRSLIKEQAREIKALLAAGDLTAAEIARRYSVSHKSITNIRDGRTWNTA